MPSFTCPKCKKTLKTAAPIPAGKSIKCPACGNLFKMPDESATAVQANKPLPRKPVKVPVDDDEEKRRTHPDDDEDELPRKKKKRPVDEDEDAGDDEDRDDDEDERPSKKKKKKKQTAGNRTMMLVGGGEALVAIVLILLFLWPGFLLSKGDKKGPVAAQGPPPLDPFSFAPSGCDVAVGVNFGQYFAKPDKLPSVQMALAQTGAPPEVFELLKTTDMVYMFLNSASPDTSTVVVITATGPIDGEKVRKVFEAGPAQTLQGKTVYRAQKGNGPPLSIALADAKTVVASPAPEPTFLQVLQAQGKLGPELQAQVQALQAKYVWAIANLQGPLQNQMGALDAMGKGNAALGPLVPAIKRAKIATVSFEQPKEATLRVELHCQNDQDATLIQGTAKKLWDTQGKMQLGLAALGLPFMLASAPNGKELSAALGKVITDVSTSLKIEAQGAVVSAQASLQESTLNALDKVNINPGAIPKQGGPQGKVDQDNPILQAQNRVLLMNNMKQVALAMHNYHDVNRRLPAPGLTHPPFKGSKQLLSWRVAILPYIEEDNLYREFKLDEPWDSPHNIKLLPKLPKIYAPLGKQPVTMKGGTYLQMFTGPKTLFPTNDTPAMFTTITDGTSNTIMVAEAGTPVPWTKPDDIALTETGPLPKLGALSPNGFFVAMADASVRFVDRPKVSDKTLRLAIDPKDGQVLPPDW